MHEEKVNTVSVLCIKVIAAVSQENSVAESMEVNGDQFSNVKKTTTVNRHGVCTSSHHTHSSDSVYGSKLRIHSEDSI